MNVVEDKLRQMGLELPAPPAPVAAYLPTVRTGNLVFVSGQVPREKGEIKYRGHVGSNLSVDEGRDAARICALNALAAVKKEIGDLDRIRRVVKVTGYVASAPGFTDQPKVVDGASVFLNELLGEKGKHARAAVGVNELPLGVAVELEMILEVTS
ncbi:MAG: RidA family protein [Acidobacteria bacterium]|nr:RidA family protein [Acidobacteriota bacterium]